MVISGSVEVNVEQLRLKLDEMVRNYGHDFIHLKAHLGGTRSRQWSSEAMTDPIDNPYSVTESVEFNSTKGEFGLQGDKILCRTPSRTPSVVMWARSGRNVQPRLKKRF